MKKQVFVWLAFLCYSMKSTWSILKISLLLPKTILLFSLSLGPYWLSAMHLRPSYSVTCFLRNLAFQSSTLMPYSFFSDDPHDFLYVLFSTSLHYFRQMVFIKFSAQALLTSHYSLSFSGFLRKKKTDKESKKIESANLLTCDSDISLDIKKSRVF